MLHTNFLIIAYHYTEPIEFRKIILVGGIILKKILGILLGVLLIGVLAACGADDDDDVITEAPEIEPLAVDLTVTNEVEVGETVHMSALVTIGDRKIDDASEVVYEVWEKGKQSESIMIDSVNEKEGIYTAETTFDHEGTFHIQVHVTAESQHTMPVEDVIVGDGGEYEETTGSDYHTEGFAMHFMKPTNVEAGDEKSLMVHIELNEEPLEALNVRYEISRESSEKHDWVDAKENAAGEYVADYTFEDAEEYTVVVHVEDDAELHEHEEHKVEVK